MAGEFWDTVHPLQDSDGIEARVASITGLNGQSGDGTLLQPLRKLTLYERLDGSRVALWQYEQSKKGEGPPFEALETEARAAGSARFAILRDEAAAALAAWERLTVTLDAKAGNDGPPTGRVRAVLEQLHDIAAAYAGPANPESARIVASGPEAAAPELAEPSGRPSRAAEPSAAASSGAPPRTREDALRALEEIASFFLRTEPLSPLSYTLQDAVRRSRMTWPELLAEIVPDWTTRTTILTSLGIKPPDIE
jgi:type VI secretion system protein ImpA